MDVERVAKAVENWAKDNADKLRRTAFAVFGGVVPREEIVRATSELNKKIYEKLISMGVEIVGLCADIENK